MPIRIQASLPAVEVLQSENIFVMPTERAAGQDIRPLKIAILNLMPTKLETEVQLLRLLSNTPLQVDVELLHTATHQSTHTSASHLNTFYHTFDDVKDQKFDGMIITGAPVEQMPFEEVDYWGEMCRIMEWTRRNVYSTMHICWGAQAGMYFHYGIPKYEMGRKLSGIYKLKVLNLYHPLMRGFDDYYYADGYRDRLAELLRERFAEAPKKRRVLITVGHLRTGGIANALYALLAEIHTLYDITLIAADGRVERDGIPPDVSVFPSDELLRATETPRCRLRELSLPAKLFRITGAAFAKLFGKRIPFLFCADG